MIKKITWPFVGLLFCSVIAVYAVESQKEKVEIGANKPPVLSAQSEKMLGDFRNAIADMADNVIPVIVNIQSEASASPQGMEGIDPFEFFFGPGFGGQPRERETPKQQALGSGVIVSKYGYILTNNHVVENASSITVTLHDQREFKAKIVGTDPQSDVALLQIENAPKDLAVAYLGNSSKLRVGEWVVAIGNPFGLSRTVTTGIVSAKGVHNRGITAYEDFIQTDAAINPGNSGGGLFNLAGELVGINTAILSRTGGFQGIGFAIPIDMARRIVEDLAESGKVSRGWLGVSIQDVDAKIAKAMQLDTLRGALVAEVMPGSPAEKAKLQVGDLIMAVDQQMVRDGNALRHAISGIKPGQKTTLRVWRDGEKQNIQVEVGAKDGEYLAAEAGTPGIGLDVEDAPDGGVRVRKVLPQSPAANAGLQRGDLILQVNRQTITDEKGFRKKMAEAGASSQILLLIQRGSGRFFVVIDR